MDSQGAGVGVIIRVTKQRISRFCKFYTLNLYHTNDTLIVNGTNEGERYFQEKDYETLRNKIIKSNGML